MEGTSRKNAMGDTEEEMQEDLRNWFDKDHPEGDIDYITGCPLLERLNPNDGMGTYIRDFGKSESPQFKGASSSKRRKMAIAAYLGAKRKKLEK
jgi:hypothetical protein